MTVYNRNMNLSMKHKLRRREYEHSRKVHKSRLQKALRTVRSRLLNGFYEETDSEDSRSKTGYEGNEVENHQRTSRCRVPNGFYEEYGSEEEGNYLATVGPENCQEIQNGEMGALKFDPFEITSKIFSCKFCDRTFASLAEKFHHWPAHLVSTESSSPALPLNSHLVEDMDLYENVDPKASCLQKGKVDSSTTVFQSHSSQDNYARPNVAFKQPSFNYPQDQGVAFTQVWKHILELKSSHCLKHMCKRKRLKHFYKCLFRECRYSTNIPAKFYKHSRGHVQEKLPCVYCYQFFTPYALMEHMTIEHSSRVYQCSKCFYRSALPELLENHHDQQHANHRFVSMHCPINYHVSILKYVLAGNDAISWKFRSIKCFVLLKNLCLPPDESLYYVCNLCNKIGLLRKKNKHYAKHPNIATEKGNFIRAASPPMSYLGSETLQGNNHLSQTSNAILFTDEASIYPQTTKGSSPPAYKCKYCDFGGKSGALIRTHCKSCHPLRPVMYTCPIIPVDKSLNSLHLYASEAKEIYSCHAVSSSATINKMSTKPSSPSSNLTQETTEAPDTSHSASNERTKQGIKIYICTYCLKQFTVYPYLYRHWKELHLPMNDKFQFTTRRVESIEPLQESSLPKRLYCKDCHLSFQSYNEKFGHMRANHWKKKKKHRKRKSALKNLTPLWEDKIISQRSSSPTFEASIDSALPSSRRAVCIFCKKHFASESSYSEHLEYFHGQAINSSFLPGPEVERDLIGKKNGENNWSHLYICLPSVHNIRIPYSSFIRFINTQPRVALEDTINKILC